MENCIYGCGEEGTIQTPKGLKCSIRFYDCPGYKQTLRKKNIFTGTTSKPKNFGGANFKGKTHSLETRKKISETMKGNTHAHHRGDRQSRYKNIRFDSKWEIGVAQWLDKNNLTWMYGHLGFKLSDNRYYYPDFFIFEDKNLIKIIEVKGYFREENKKKFEMFLKEYPDIVTELWNKEVLINKDIINTQGYLK